MLPYPTLRLLFWRCWADHTKSQYWLKNNGFFQGFFGRVFFGFVCVCVCAELSFSDLKRWEGCLWETPQSLQRQWVRTCSTKNQFSLKRVIHFFLIQKNTRVMTRYPLSSSWYNLNKHYKTWQMLFLQYNFRYHFWEKTYIVKTVVCFPAADTICQG